LNSIKKYILFTVKLLALVVLLTLIYFQLEDKQISILSLTNLLMSLSLYNYILLVIVVLLMPLNWFIEAFKWKILISLINDHFSFQKALKSVLLGVFSGFITPNRIGEFGGRLSIIPKGSRLKALQLSVYGGLAQLIVTTVIGFISSLFIFTKYNNQSLIIFVILFVISILFIFFNFNNLLLFLLKFKITSKYLKKFMINIELRKSFSLRILLITFLRYTIYVTQYVLLFFVFNVDLDFIFLFQIIAIMLFIQTILPTFALLDIGIKGNILLFLLKNYLDNQQVVLIVVFLVWILNLVLPAVIGYLNFTNLKMEVNYEKISNNINNNS